jgi:hypothetical protein
LNSLPEAKVVRHLCWCRQKERLVYTEYDAQQGKDYLVVVQLKSENGYIKHQRVERTALPYRVLRLYYGHDTSVILLENEFGSVYDVTNGKYD